jgi:hypothetical protein
VTRIVRCLTSILFAKFEWYLSLYIVLCRFAIAVQVVHVLNFGQWRQANAEIDSLSWGDALKSVLLLPLRLISLGNATCRLIHNLSPFGRYTVVAELGNYTTICSFVCSQRKTLLKIAALLPLIYILARALHNYCILQFACSILPFRRFLNCNSRERPIAAK